MTRNPHMYVLGGKSEGKVIYTARLIQENFPK